MLSTDVNMHNVDLCCLKFSSIRFHISATTAELFIYRAKVVLTLSVQHFVCKALSVLSGLVYRHGVRYETNIGGQV